MDLEQIKAHVKDESLLRKFTKAIFDNNESDGKVRVEDIQGFMYESFEGSGMEVPEESEILAAKKGEGGKFPDEEIDYEQFNKHIKYMLIAMVTKYS